MMTLRRALFAAITIVLLPAASHGASDCTAEWRWALDLAQLEAESTFRPSRVAAGGCHIRDVTMRSGDDFITLRIGSLFWNADGMTATMANGTPPHALTFNAKDVRLISQIDDPVFDYLLSAQAAPNGIDVDLVAHWSRPDRALILDKLQLDFPGDNDILLTAAFERVNLASLGAAQMSVGSAVLRRAHLRLTTKGLFESYGLMALGLPLLEGADDPEAEVDSLKEQAIDVLNAMPATLMPEPSKAAARALIAAMPNPYGTITLDIDAPGGVGPARLGPVVANGTPKTPSELWALLDGVELGLTYVPAD